MSLLREAFPDLLGWVRSLVTRTRAHCYFTFDVLSTALINYLINYRFGYGLVYVFHAGPNEDKAYDFLV